MTKLFKRLMTGLEEVDRFLASETARSNGISTAANQTLDKTVLKGHGFNRAANPTQPSRKSMNAASAALKSSIS